MLDERTDSSAVDAMEAAATPPRPPQRETEPAPLPRAFCWACGTTHTDADICIPRTE